MAPISAETFLTDHLHERAELVRGKVTPKPPTSAEHAGAQAAIVRRVGGRLDRKSGGWWFFPELDVRFGEEVLRPDVCGFRRDRLKEKPTGHPVLTAPDWVCEVLSPSNATFDRVEKLQTCFAAGVGHYWLVDPIEGSLEIFRRTDLAYALVQSAHRGQRLRPEPFDALEFSVDELLGDDPEGDDA